MVRRKVPSIKTSALFVTRFSPNVTVQDIKDLINTSLTLSHLKISKIQSKHQDQYSSFHVEVLVSDYSKIDDVSLWPDGCLMKQYRGRLLPEIVVSDTSSDTSVNTAAPGTSVNSAPRDATVKRAPPGTPVNSAPSGAPVNSAPSGTPVSNAAPGTPVNVIAPGVPNASSH
ncbi:hypothetical protein M8J76_015968 [Diaphorina citri]|nr:hypothetical protein M8J76_015968 [Diaphorina citri]